MKHNLGKILLVLLFPMMIFAQVSLKAPDNFYQGDSIEFSITASGKDIVIPQINEIDGFVVQSLGTSTQTRIINGDKTEKYIKNYALKATKDITIPPFDITIDGNVESTKPQTVVMKKVEKTVSDDYDLTLSINKKEVFVGEEIHLVLLFKYKKDLNIVGLEFEKPNFENFWTKELKPNENLPTDSQYTYQKLEYLLFAQKSGNLNIGPLKIESVTAQDRYSSSFFVTSPTQRTKIYSNEFSINVKPLPKDIKLIGDFTVDATVDKQTLKKGEAVSYKVTIQGRGNVDDIDEVKLNIKDTTIYENPAEKIYDIKDKLYGGVYTKAFSIVTTKNFTIPAIQLQYFDKKTQTVKTIETKSFDIDVEATKNKEVKLEVSEEKTDDGTTQQIVKNVKISNNEKILFFILGILVGAVIVAVVFLLLQKKSKSKKEDTPLIKLLKKSKTKEKLLKLLVVFIKIDKNLDKIIFSLENKQNDQELKTIKKEIIDIFNSLEKKGIALDTKFL